MPDLSIKVSLPPFYPKFLVNKFLKDKENWIRQAQQRLQTTNLQQNDNEYFFLGKKYQLVLRHNQKKCRRT